MTATRAPRPIPLSIRAEDLLVAAAILDVQAAKGRPHLAPIADRLSRAATQLTKDNLETNPCPTESPSPSSAI